LFEQEKKLATRFEIKDKVIDLNVGGRHFSTYKSTLCKIEGSMLSAMFSGRHELLNREQWKMLLEWCGLGPKDWKLCFRASKDGFSASAFHSKCDNKGPTLTVVKSRHGFLFGGYTSISWTSRRGYAWDSNAFLFSLTNPQNKPCKLPIESDSYSIYDHSGYGPNFGDDLQLNGDLACSFNLGSRYANPEWITFDDSNSVGVSEVEVFCLKA
jgi:hypothetical protein